MNFLSLIAWVDGWSVHLPTTAALAAVALLGYMFGQRTRQLVMSEKAQSRRELKRARLVAQELEKIADTIRKDLAIHRASVARFKERLSAVGTNQNDIAWKDLCREAEEILKPTLKLAMQISLAYDEIRQQSSQLMTFTEVRTDALTGISNRRALDETLENMFAMMTRYESPFAIALVDIDHFKQINDHQGHLYGDRVLQKFARLLDDSIRDTDMVARYGGEEFVVIMPHTSLQGACIFGERLRQIVEKNLPLTISGGIAMAQPGDNSQSLLSRADSALYSAKAGGRNVFFQHDGELTSPAAESEAPAAVEATAPGAELEQPAAAGE